MLQSGDRHRCSKAPSLPVESRGCCGDGARPRGTGTFGHRGHQRGPPDGAGPCPPPARSLHPSALRCATRQARVGNDTVVPNVCSVCWDFTGDDK